MIHDNFYVTPFSHHPMVVKMTHSGVTVLKDDRFRSRIQGSRSHTVRANGLLVDNKTLAKLEKPAELPKKRPDGKKVTLPPADQGEPQVPREYRINKKLIRARVSMFIMAQEKPVLHAFTVSFPPCVTDAMGHQLLNTWLTVCREDLHLREYLWVCERQEKGTIHFHVLIPQYLNVTRANRAMRVAITTQIRKGNLDWNLHAAKRYNGVDISKNRTTKRITNFAKGSSRKALVSYITKYVSKNDGSFSHFAWHNSRGFSSMALSVSLTEAEARLYGVRSLLNMDKVFAGEYAYFIPWKSGAPDFFTGPMRMLNRLILNKGSGPLKILISFNVKNLLSSKPFLSPSTDQNG